MTEPATANRPGDAALSASPLTASPARVFWSTWAGWMLDGFDAGLYGFVLVAALTDLLRRLAS